MKVRVSIPGASMTMDLKDEAALSAFHKMTELLCSYKEKMTMRERVLMSAAVPALKKMESYPVPADPEASDTSGDGQEPEKVLVGKPAKIRPAVHEKPEEPAPLKPGRCTADFCM